MIKLWVMSSQKPCCKALILCPFTDCSRQGFVIAYLDAYLRGTKLSKAAFGLRSWGNGKVVHIGISMRTCNNECIGMKGRGFRHDRIIGGARAGNLLFFPFSNFRDNDGRMGNRVGCKDHGSITFLFLMFLKELFPIL